MPKASHTDPIDGDEDEEGKAGLRLAVGGKGGGCDMKKGHEESNRAYAKHHRPVVFHFALTGKHIHPVNVLRGARSQHQKSNIHRSF